MKSKGEIRTKRLWDWCVRQEEFTIEEAWKATRVHYGYISKTLIEWWRAGLLLKWNRYDKTWHEGFLFSKCGTGLGFTGRYRWAGED
jgi:hypothetical protein